MMARAFAAVGSGSWGNWLAFGTGALVTLLVIGCPTLYRRLRGWRRPILASREEDLPWAELLVLVEKRNRDRAAAGLQPQEATEEELARLIAELPAVANPRPLELPEDREFAPALGSEQPTEADAASLELPENRAFAPLTRSDRRAGRRRWGNPMEVQLRLFISGDELHGLVVNRSTGGLGILVDKEIPPGTFVTIRNVDAPSYVPSAWIEILYCRHVGKGFILGCRFDADIPWNIRVWFG